LGIPGKFIKHGQARGSGMTPEYAIWRTMRQRCSNPNSQRWKDYGGRGIRVCDEWNSFAVFFSHIGPRPSLNHSIDRINNDGHYEPGNVRWATDFEQQQNTRKQSRRHS
jgi:hypothetical protein